MIGIVSLCPSLFYTLTLSWMNYVYFHIKDLHKQHISLSKGIFYLLFRILGSNYGALNSILNLKMRIGLHYMCLCARACLRAYNNYIW